MQLVDEDHSVLIVGQSHSHTIQIKMSILQFAKICGSDGDIASDVQADFGSQEYEDKCTETKRLVTLFPTIPIWDKDLLIDEEVEVFNDGIPNTSETIQLVTEDIVGWDNEGILLTMPKEFYNLHVKHLHPIQMIISPFKVFLKSKKTQQQKSLV